MANARQLILDLLARDKTGPGARSAADNLKTVGDAAADAAKSTEKLGDSSDRTEDQVERFGKSARTAAEHVEDLDREIENVERELTQLAIAWKEAESAAEKADLSKAIRRTQKDLREIDKNKGLLGALIPEPSRLAAEASKAGAEVGTTFLASVSKAAAAASGPAGLGAAIGASLAAGSFLPVLGASVSSAILGGAGVGGVIGGFALAKRDTRVKAAAKSLGDEVMKSLDQRAGVFVPVVLDGIEQIGDSFDKIDEDLGSIFENSARYVQPLVEGVTGLIERAIGGAAKAVEGAAPVIDVLSKSLPELGAVIGDVLESLSDNGPEAAAALEQVFRVIEGAVTTTGAVINGLTELYGIFAASGALGDEAQKTWEKYATEAKNAATASDALAGKQHGVAIETKSAAEAAEVQRKALIDLSKELRAQVDPLFGFVNAQEKVEAAQKDLTEAIKKYGPKSDEAAAATRNLAAAALDLNGRAAEVGTTADGKLTPALRRALTEAGLTKAEIRGVETQLRNAKTALDNYDGTQSRASVFADTALAMDRLQKVKNLLGKVKSKSITVSVGVSGAAALAALQTGKLLSGRAAGGPVTAGVPYIVGERRAEVFVPESNGRIVPSVGAFAGSARSASPARDSGGWVAIRGDAIIDALTQAIASRVSAKGGRAAQLGIRLR